MTPELLGALAAILAMTGVYLIYTSMVFGWTGLGRAGAAANEGSTRGTTRTLVSQVGLQGARPHELLAAGSVLALVGGLVAYVMFGGLLPAGVAATACCLVPIASFRARRAARIETAREAWPRLLEELRLLIGSMGRSVPQALFEVGRRAPDEWRPAFEAAEREWLLTTDFA
ncbi:MAG TPA: hypothetical protein VFV02_16605, partial [Acidimicrobiales bacterium]|nr:hypothetical protein [Acidimicrobiales bacterium]